MRKMQQTKLFKKGWPVLFFSMLLIGISSCDLMDSPEAIVNENDALTYEKNLGNRPVNNPVLFSYYGHQSGLFSWGNNYIANTFKTNYLNANMAIKTLDAAGNSSINGKIGILEIGGSNPAIIYEGLKTNQLNDAGFGSKLTFVNAGMNAMDFSDILKPTTNYWTNVQTFLNQSGITAAQVQVIFCIEDNLKNLDVTFNRATSLQNDYISLLNLVRSKYPNCKLFLVGDRGYSGYATDPRHKEPIGYLNGWGVKLFVQQYTDGLLPMYPAVDWLDYYWANGETPRFDGLTYSEDDYRPGFIHFSDEKAEELGAGTHAKLKSDIGTSYWYK